MIIESVRSQKSTTPATVRFTTPPQSTRQQAPPKKLAQSVSVPQIRASPSIDQQTKHGTKGVTTPHKSLMVAVQPTKPSEEEIDDDGEADRTAQDVTETVLQLRMDSEEKQRQLIIAQQRLVNLKRFQMFFFMLKFRINNEN